MGKKSPWLAEVEADAKRITLKRIRDAEEEKAYKASKEAEEPSEQKQKGSK